MKWFCNINIYKLINCSVWWFECNFFGICICIEYLLFTAGCLKSFMPNLVYSASWVWNLKSNFGKVVVLEILGG